MTKHAVATPIEVEKRARALLDALDRMFGRQHLSHNVSASRDQLRELFPVRRDPQDQSGPPS